MSGGAGSGPLYRAAVPRLAAVLPFAALGLLGVLAGCVSPGARPANGPPETAALAREIESPERRFTILQVNDVYKIEGLEGGRLGGLGRIRALRRDLEAEGPVLVLHGGDALYPSVMSKFLDAKPMVECLNLLDGDPAAFDPRLFVVFGNHEFDPPAPFILIDRLKQSDFSWLSSNIYFRPEPGARPEPFHRRFKNVRHSVVLDVAGLKVAIFSITVDDSPRDYLHYDYALGDDGEGVRNAVVRATLAGLEEQDPDVIVALTHQEMSEDKRLARDFPEIDLVVGGHDHLAQLAWVGDTLITKADADAKTAYVIEVDARDPAGVATTARRVALDESVEPDPEIQKTVAVWLERLAAKVPDFDTVYGTTEHRLGGEEPLLRGGESAMGNWLTDVLRETLATDVAVIHGGSIRINDNVPAGGQITGEHLEGIFYFGGDAVSFEVSGRELLELLRNSVSKVDLGDGRFLQVSGLRFRYRAAGEPGQRRFQVEPEWVEVRRRGDAEYRPLDLAATYTMATVEYLWKYGSRQGFELFSGGDGGSSPELIGGAGGEYDWRQITVDSLAAEPRVTAGVEGRIRVVKGEVPPAMDR